MDNKYLSQIRSFGAMGYSPERIADLLNLSKEERVELTVRLSLPGDEYHNAYKNGMAVGEWNIDAELAKQAEKGDIDAIAALGTRTKERQVNDLKKRLFGI